MPPAGRVLPGMPLDFEDIDADDEPRLVRGGRYDRYDQPLRPWWRPASTAGRLFLTLAALTLSSSLAFAAFALNTCLERDARFRIAGTEDIQATGLTEVTRGQILPVFGADIGRNIFFVPLNQRRTELEQIPWIERATVMRLLPDQLRISIVERRPVAFTRHGDRIGLVDAKGVLLTMPAAAMAVHHYSFPVLTGIDPGDPPAARRERMAVYLRLMSDLDSTGQRLSDQISEIDLTDPEDARVLMPEQGKDILAHFGEDHFLERYQRYKAYIAEWRQQYPRLAAVDLRYDRQVILEMSSGKQASEADPSGAKPQAGAPAVDSTDASPSTAAPAGKTGKKAHKLKKPAALIPARRRAAAGVHRAGNETSIRTNWAQGG